MDGHGNTSEEATSPQGTKSASDLESEVEVPEHDAAWPMPINAAWRLMPPPPCCCSHRSSVRLGHISRDDQCKAGGTGKFPSHMYKTLTPAAEKPVCRIAIPETAPGTHRPNPSSKTPGRASIHRKFQPPPTTCALGREQVKLTPQLDS
ncbi:hypothetical protein BHM03_00029125 [Ensete ventricosum]|nr:hypothetical protein BHM03_00029125 [Ensete ventricosum]